MSPKIIEKAMARIWRAKLTQPFRTAKGQHELLENVLFTVELSHKTRGYGEAAVATHITGETVRETLEHLKAVAREICGRDLAAFRAVAGEMKERFPQNPCARAAVEMALLDALTREKRMPLWRFFGSKPRTLRSDMTVVLGEVADAAAMTRAILRRGIRSFKIKIGRNFDEDLRRVTVVAALAPRRPIYLDANQGFTAGQTLKFLKELKTLKIRPALIEQPIPKGDWEGLKQVARQSDVPVCADESASSLADVKRLIREKAADVINIKFMKTGIFEAWEIAKLAQRHGIKLMIGTMMETALATTAAAHFAAGLRGFDFIDLDAPLFIDQKITRGFHPSIRGVYDLRGIKAGIGVAPLLS
ncbi:MAG: dipeptide epimerase [Candidatus Omnitrophica bacterium]|nr:dipeptide epimerase [Candidatus Omnitrophota bacterium]